MFFAVIIGTIIWFAILKFLSKRVTIFATPKAWVSSWIFVILLIATIGGCK